MHSTSLLYKFLLINLGAGKPTFFFSLYTTSEEKEYYEALFLSYSPLQSAVFHNFSRQIAFNQYSGPSKHALACEQQTHFRSSLFSLRKIAPAISSSKTISVTSFLFFFTRPMKLSDRKMLLKTRGKSRGPTTASEVALCTHEWGNAEKSYLGRRRLFFV